MYCTLCCTDWHIHKGKLANTKHQCLKKKPKILHSFRSAFYPGISCMITKDANLSMVIPMNKWKNETDWIKCCMINRNRQLRHVTKWMNGTKSFIQVIWMPLNMPIPASQGPGSNKANALERGIKHEHKKTANWQATKTHNLNVFWERGSRNRLPPTSPCSVINT